MFPRLIIVSVVGLSALSGCKHRDSFSEVGSPSASVQPVAAVETSERSNPLTRLGDVFFRARDATVAETTEESVVDGEDPIEHLEDGHSDICRDGHSTVSGVQPDRSCCVTRCGPVTTHRTTQSKWPSLGAYTLDTGDRIRIFVYGQPNLSRVYNVDGQGRVSVPLVGSVLARGRTTRRLEGIIRSGLSVKYVKDPKVSIEVAVYRPFFIHGEVRSPGQFPYVYGMTVEAAIATAGGFSPRARKNRIQVVRTVDGIRNTMAIDAANYLRPGDIITVEERFF